MYIRSGFAARGVTKQAKTSSHAVKWKENIPDFIVRRAATDFGWFVLLFIVCTSLT